MTKSVVAKDWSTSLFTWLDGAKCSFPLPGFTPGTFYNLTPGAVTPGSEDTLLGQGFAVCRKTGRLYWCNGPFASGGGLYVCNDWWFKTTGWTWTLIGKCNPFFGGAANYITNPLHVEVDPGDPNRLVLTSGVRGDNLGLFISRNKGLNFVRPPSIASTLATAGVTGTGSIDFYHVAVDPTDFNHQLATFHTDWGAGFSDSSGILRTTDFWETCSVIPPEPTWDTGHNIFFLYDSATAQGNSSTWLVGTQLDGYWRTSNAGSSFAQVLSGASVNITHGGCQPCYAPDGKLYVPGDPAMYRSTDNGQTFTNVYTTQNWAIATDGTTLFTGHATATDQVQQSAVSSGTSYSDYGSTSFVGGPFRSRYFQAADIMLFSFWKEGIQLVKLH